MVLLRMSAGTELITEWLEQFELVVGVCKWDNSTKLVNLVNKLKGEAYCTGISFMKESS